MQKDNILIVDDEAIMRKVMRMSLSKAGYTCDEAENADMALEKLRNSTYALAIIDIMMPGKSGIELLHEIKTAHPNTFVFMSTAVNDPNVAVQCMKEGAFDYLSKPFSPDDLIQAVQRTLEKRNEELKLKDHQQDLEKKVVQQTGETRQVFVGAVESLISALESKDKYTAGHSRRVALLTDGIGKMLTLSQKELDDLCSASLLHDIGKIAIDQRIQNKPGKLTPEEYAIIRTHSKIGAQIVKPLVNETISKIIEYHHSFYSGDLITCSSTDTIPMGARIIAVADAYDAMTSDRPYRHAMPAEAALKEIQRCSGTQFDPEIVPAFVNLLSSDLMQAKVLTALI
jgi:putative two-component system response regulator